MTTKKKPQGDIRYNSDNDLWCVIGFFTPNYRARADRLSGLLKVYGIPHHFVAVRRMGWHEATLQKPQIVKRFLVENPKRIHILMDVDCHVSGDLTPLIDGQGLDIKINDGHRGKNYVSTRISVWYPTKRAELLATFWAQECEHVRDESETDELCLTRVLGDVPALKRGRIPEQFDADEQTHAGQDAIVTHWSAHDEDRFVSRWKKRTKRFRRKLVAQLLGVPNYEDWKYGGMR